MNYDEAFVQEVRANPHDDAPRLIFADYLEEAGDPRGELIRVQVELAALPAGDAARAGLEQRESELLDAYAKQWLEPLRRLGAQGVSVRCFHKGLIERIKIETAAWLENGAELCRVSPALHCVELRRVRDERQRLAQSAFPTQVTTLDLSANQLTREDIEILRDAPWTSQLVELQLQFNRLEDDGLSLLASANWPRLRRLSLGINRIGPAGAQTISAWPSPSQLTRLSLNVNSIGDAGVSSIAGSERMSKLEELDLSSNGITSRGALALAEAGGLSSLRVLQLRGNQVNRQGRDALAESPALAALEILDLRGNALDRHRGDYGTREREPEDLLIRVKRGGS